MIRASDIYNGPSAVRRDERLAHPEASEREAGRVGKCE